MLQTVRQSAVTGPLASNKKTFSNVSLGKLEVGLALKTS
jgi:hypothetical protein